VGNTQLSISDMAGIQSVAITFKSTNSNTPQAAFTNANGDVISYACIPITCASGACNPTGSLSVQDFTLKANSNDVAIGDPADGGVIGCTTSSGGFNLVVTTLDQNAGQAWWPGAASVTGATGTTDGAANTTRIVTSLGLGSTYAARTCKDLSIDGGFTSDWFLPSGGANGNQNTQIYCLYRNITLINSGSAAAGGTGISAVNSYWSSTEVSAANAYRQGFGSGVSVSSTKTSTGFRVRCTRAF
jgi:hypothetical protein